MEKEGKGIPAAPIPRSKDKREKSGGLLINESSLEGKVVLECALFILQEGLELKEQGKNMSVQDLYFFSSISKPYFEVFLYNLSK